MKIRGRKTSKFSPFIQKAITEEGTERIWGRKKKKTM